MARSDDGPSRRFAVPRTEKLRLRDRLRPGLVIVSIGINPSVYSAIRGFNFARPGNRFWPALNASGMVAHRLEPGRAAMDVLFTQYNIGFTDMVPRATARADELGDEEYARGARSLKRKLVKYQPAIAWFHGTSAFQKYLEYAEGSRRRVLAGLQ